MYPICLGEYPRNTHFLAFGLIFYRSCLWIWTEGTQPKTLRGNEVKIQVWENTFDKPFKGVSNFKTRVGNVLIKDEAVRTNSTHRYLETPIVNIIALATSRRCRFFLSMILFCCGAWKQVDWWKIPFSFRKFPRI